MKKRLFLFCDLDGTLAPYGPIQGSPEAKDAFHRLANRPEVLLAYVTGRAPREARDVIAEHRLPMPHYLSTDTGATIEFWTGDAFSLLTEWWSVMQRDWCATMPADIFATLSGVAGLTPQEEQYQNRFKVCYYTDYCADGPALVNRVQCALLPLRIRAQVLWSRDDHRKVGYVDVVPTTASKWAVVQWLLNREDVSPEQALFAGDSVNDLSALSSGLRAVMPRNGKDEVHREACRILERKERGLSKRLYKAQGGFLGFDGHVLGGVLEGVCRHFPQTREWMVPET